MSSRELHEEALRRQAASIVASNEEARRRVWDTEDRWSTASVSGGDRGNLRLDYPMRDATAESENLDHHRDFVYKADHFIWTFKCHSHNCNWQLASQTETNYCQKCNSGGLYKYLTFTSTWRLVSEWYARSRCDQWFYLCIQ